ncbi:MAG TPA: CBS domain-containing protein [Cellvibrio sp.]
MKIKDIMTHNVETLSADSTICEAACAMEKADCGAILVKEGDRLVGMITDRDIAIRAVANGLNHETPISKVMTEKIRYCFEDEDIQHVAENMADIQLRRLPVLNRDKRLVGVVSLGNIASCRSQKASATVLQGVAKAH